MSEWLCFVLISVPILALLWYKGSIERGHSLSGAGYTPSEASDRWIWGMIQIHDSALGRDTWVHPRLLVGFVLLNLLFCRSLFVPLSFLVAILLSFIIRCMPPTYHIGIFKLVLLVCLIKKSSSLPCKIQLPELWQRVAVIVCIRCKVKSSSCIH